MKHHLTQRGFTIIEAFIAAVLFTLAVAGAMSLAARTLSFSVETRDRITATYLANEGLEYVKNARQTNVLKGAEWLETLDSCTNAAGGCYVETFHNNGSKTVAQSVHTCGSSCPALKYNTSTGRKTYEYTSSSGNPWVNTTFVRKIVITQQQPNIEALVTVTVTWQGRKTSYVYTVQDTLFNWQ